MDDTRIRRVEEVFDRLKARDISVTPLARQIIFAAIDGIILEPSRHWPAPVRDDSGERDQIQDRLIDALGYHLMTLRHGLKSNEIAVFDAINLTYKLSLDCCLIGVPPDLR